MSLKNGLRWSDFKCIIKSLKVKNSKDLKLIGWDTKKTGVDKVRIGDLLCLRRIGTRMREVVDNFFFLTVEFSVYFSSKPFIRCVGYRCFLSPCSLCFWPLTRTVAEQKFLILMTFTWSVFFSCELCFCCQVQESFPEILRILSSFFFSKGLDFYILHLHFELISLKGEKTGFDLFFTYKCPLAPQLICWKRSFLPWIAFAPCPVSVGHPCS